MGNEREKFSQRLANAMQQAGYDVRPKVLFNLFNSHYRGRSVTFQTTSRWLAGKAAITWRCSPTSSAMRRTPER